MSSDAAICCENVGKAYAVYRRPEDRLKQMLASFLRLRGKQYYSAYWALRDVSFSIKPGESIGIIGRNGSGKSTLLQTICGTLTPTTGRVAVNGKIAALLELGAGFNPEFTGRENVFLAAAILGLSEQQTRDRYESIEAFAGIGDFIDQPVKFYSSGMYARLAFAVVAHVDPDILIIDEILAVGDAAFTQKCMRFIRQFKERGTLLFVSHDAQSVINLCDRALWLDKGQAREIGPAKEVCHNYFVAVQAENEDPARFQIGGRQTPVRPVVVLDPRKEVLQSSQARNTIELFDFDPNAKWFGERKATITNVRLRSPEGTEHAVLEGGERVMLEITATAHAEIDKPIFGFYVKDKLGQQLFGDNSFLTYQSRPLIFQSGAALVATFTFQLPYLPPGDFSITAALASGTQANHVQHHWLEDCLFFRVVSSHLHRGLMGIPMLEIRIDSAAEADRAGVLT